LSIEKELLELRVEMFENEEFEKLGSGEAKRGKKCGRKSEYDRVTWTGTRLASMESSRCPDREVTHTTIREIPGRLTTAKMRRVKEAKTLN
jgi:hypothetical protein